MLQCGVSSRKHLSCSEHFNIIFFEIRTSGVPGMQSLIQRTTKGIASQGMRLYYDRMDYFLQETKPAVRLHSCRRVLFLAVTRAAGGMRKLRAACSCSVGRLSGCIDESNTSIALYLLFQSAHLGVFCPYQRLKFNYPSPPVGASQ